MKTNILEINQRIKKIYTYTDEKGVKQRVYTDYIGYLFFKLVYGEGLNEKEYNFYKNN